MSKQNTQTLKEQRIAFSKKRFLAMHLAGGIIWTIIGIVWTIRGIIGATIPPVWQKTGRYGLVVAAFFLGHGTR